MKNGGWIHFTLTRSTDIEQLLTLKIPYVFLPKYVVFDIVGEIIFFKIQSIRT
jgi:hypothetical protein